MSLRRIPLRLVVPTALALLFLVDCHRIKPHHPHPGQPGAVVAEGPLNPDGRQALLAEPTPSTGIPLIPPEGEPFRFVIDNVQPAGRGKAYLGHVAGAEGSSGTIVVLGSAISGSIHIVGRPVYTLATDREGRPVIRAVDPSRLPPDHPEGFGAPPGRGTVEPPPPLGLTGDTCSTDDPTRITLMALYTQAARLDAGGTDAIEATIYAAIAQMNEAFVNSDINTQIELVHLAETDYVSTGNFLTDVCRLHDPGDGFLDGVQAQRDATRADLVVLFTPPGSSCGVTYGQLLDTSLGCTVGSNHDVVRSPGNVHEGGAYHALAMDCIETNFTLPHELGHSGSARHNWACDPSDNRPTHSNHGFFFDDATPASWRTILTYPAFSGCGTNGNRVAQFSNPAISFLGHPTGTTSEPQPADNHDVLNMTRGILANYRCSAPPPSNVWMKDMWSDTGAEPNPDPGIVYASPYVWTRNSADTTVAGLTDRYQHEHQHQNPVLHQPAWGYVKLHNNGSSGAAGTVKLYYANASTSLSWPSAWTLIGSVPVTAASFAAGSTKVVQIPWADPPGTGHYCLTARWESPSDPIPPETTDINSNTRNSNNVIWRNLEILGMSGGDALSSFIARPMNGRALTIEFATPGPRPFLPRGEITVTLEAVGAPLDARPRDGVTEVGPGRYRIDASGARIDLVLPQSASGLATAGVSPFVKVEVRFHRPADLERRTYRVVINQLEQRYLQQSPVETLVGGVAYDLEP